ncbi:acyl-CoA dehydrogenase family protein [Sporolactobacillus sp. KGMB 08714]|uniref:acyl-CoA dehydrogenase family protein n=1 Tax=Sporolactobacillus sp. KGMB 08714 TaxID=3064704 RepID=UPI002FBE1652
MNFNLSEEQSLIQESAREIAENLSDLSAVDALKNLAETDFLGLFFSEDAGGAGGDFLSYIVALQEIAKVSASVALAYAVHCTQACYAIAAFAGSDLKKKYLPALFSGEKTAAYALGEGWRGKDLLNIEARAVKADDEYIINGEKTFVYGGASADIYIVFAKTDRGLSAFIVNHDTGGVAVSENYEKMGMDQITLNTVTFKNVHIPDVNIIGNEESGDEIRQSVFNLHSISLASIACGILTTAIEKTVTYGKERVQFNRPILSFEAMSEKLGHMMIKAEAARLLTFKAAAQWDANDEAYVRSAYHARDFSMQSGEEICTAAIQMHGGYGYSKDLGVEALLRDIKGLSVFENLTKPMVLMAASADI